MDIRTAILKAADHIEGNPDTFRFMHNRTPGDCGTPGCALGWIGYFMGREEGEIVCYTSEALFGLEELKFYHRMNAVYGTPHWIHGAGECAKALRLFADKHVPADGIPDTSAKWIRQDVGSWAACGFQPGAARV